MKRFLIFAIIPFHVFGQNALPQLRGEALRKSVAEKAHIASFERVKYSNAPQVETSISNFWLTNASSLQHPLSNLQLVQKSESLIGIHLYYQQMFNGIPVYNGYLKINVNKNGEQLSSFNHLYDTRNWQKISPSPDVKENWIVVENDKPYLSSREVTDGNEIIYDANHSQLFSTNLKMNDMNDDTMVTTKVFMPDPLTTSSVLYGANGTYRNFNDSDYSLLNDQRFSATFPATLDGDTFRLQNKYCRIVDMQPPQCASSTPPNTPSVSITPDFTYLRSQEGFKDAMVMFHIYHYQQYLNSIGIHNAVPWSLKIDPAGFDVDNSYFLPDVDTAIYLGIGGVPDAEDADVIVHEYTHAVRFSLNAAWPVGNDRWAVEEGLCDIMAALYSRALNDFNWRWVYNWDGHNEFWCGRDASRVNDNPCIGLSRLMNYSDTDGERYHDSQIWSSCILDIDEEVGRDVVTELLLTSVYSYTPNTTMPEAAQLFMQADSLLFNKTNTWRFGKYFNERQLGNFATGINDVVNASSFKILNTAGFFNGDGPATISLSDPADVIVFDMNGKRKFEKLNITGEIKLEPSLFEKGMYILQIKSETINFNSKLLREN